ncbi:hypothetical protein [Parabacteroides sp.]|uniref:hypothetical protein n=1 Tax=Parabacteroides sp. TaxID=1869337 RepID=UPI0030806B5B
MIDNEMDIDIYPAREGWNVIITYWYYNRNKEKRKLSSSVTYTWFTDCKEIIDFLRKKKTKVFFSQLKALTRQFGKKEKTDYKTGKSRKHENTLFLQKKIS